MKQFTSLVFLISTSAMTIGCSSGSHVLTVPNPFQSDDAARDPFHAAAATSHNDASAQPQSATPPSPPGYAATNGASQPAIPGRSQPGWSTTRHAHAMAASPGMPPQPRQTSAATPENVQLTFRATSSFPESQTEVVNSPARPVQETVMPAIGESASRETEPGDPFEEGTVKTADFIETEKSTITQLGAEQPSNSSPATLEMPVFADEPVSADEEDPFGKASSQPAEEEPEWWNQ